MPTKALNIVHVLRAPVGGLFRHVLDLARGQAALGHRVGIVADSSTGGERAAQALSEIAPQLTHGVTRVTMSRHLGSRDLFALGHVRRRIAASEADIVHGHGAKGGAYARLAGGSGPIRVYTPHGGSIHYGRDSLVGRFYLAAETMLLPRGDLYLFESEFSARIFAQKIGHPKAPACVVHNGVTAAEFDPIALSAEATDVVFLGEMRALKGVDVLIDALAALKNGGRTITATLIGDGPDKDDFIKRVRRHGLENSARFLPPMPVRKALALGRVMVVPSRAESLPYVVLEAAAAAKPLVATRVGGIMEIFGPHSQALVLPEPQDIALAIARALDEPASAADLARKLRERVAAKFSTENMIAGVMGAYAQAHAWRHANAGGARGR